MDSPWTWLVGLSALPGLVLAAYGWGMRGRRFYVLSTVSASSLVVVSAIPLIRGTPVFAPLSIVLVPFAALLWLIAVVVTPTARLNESGVARTAAACLLHMGAFLTLSSGLLVLLWIATIFVYVIGHSEEHFARARRVAVVHLGASAVLLAAGVVLAAWARRGSAASLEQWGIGLILLAVLIRKGIFPFHAWIPEIFEQGRIGPAARFNATQIGAYVALVLAVPYAAPSLLRGVAVLALVTSVYGAVLALHQSDARRACGYLFVSQSAMVIAGLSIPGREALVGAVILWICSGVALAGLSRAVLALEARRGRLRLDVRHGGYERMPQLAACFLVMSLAIANFPGTLGFVGGEMFLRGAVDSFPLLGLAAVIAAALNGLAAIRMYFSLFCGKRDSGPHLKLGRAEGFGFAVAAAFLIGFGIAPRGLIRVLDRANVAISVRADSRPLARQYH